MSTYLQTSAGDLPLELQGILEIAPALCLNLILLLLDEPAAGLRLQGKHELAVLLRMMPRQILTLMGPNGAGKITTMHPVVLFEQNARAALGLADHGIVLKMGALAAEGASASLAADPRLLETYPGQRRV